MDPISATATQSPPSSHPLRTTTYDLGSTLSPTASGDTHRQQPSPPPHLGRNRPLSRVNHQPTSVSDRTTHVTDTHSRNHTASTVSRVCPRTTERTTHTTRDLSRTAAPPAIHPIAPAAAQQAAPSAKLPTPHPRPYLTPYSCSTPPQAPLCLTLTTASLTLPQNPHRPRKTPSCENKPARTKRTQFPLGTHLHQAPSLHTAAPRTHSMSHHITCNCLLVPRCAAPRTRCLAAQAPLAHLGSWGPQERTSPHPKFYQNFDLFHCAALLCALRAFAPLTVLALRAKHAPTARCGAGAVVTFA
ncbi:hypothetical protein K458DRAFT_167001 [Lentithecium fluviatile CBS 122367]|uniref:Uncharacterized protein n=1 Tax=Lentithecium fluviatile CBS 122367 TaxID=1168545 RepID=A0A6G1IFL7_9PLEO|nr:hypothetical protein K458DRAFT_167001 [Lentithecium fluviatile CBS 122367]